MTIFPIRLSIFAAIFAALVSTSAVKASEPSSMNSNKAGGWEFLIAPYAFIPNIKGDITIAGNTVSLDLSISDLLDIVSESDSFFIWTSYMEARKGPLALYLDIVYGDLALSQDGLTIRPGGPLGATAAIGMDYTYAIVEGGIAYEVWNSFSRGGMKDAGGGSGQHTAIDVFAGLRWWYQELGLSLDLNIAPGIQPGIAKSGSVDWVDPLIGMRVRNQFAPGKSLNFRGDIGGFGVNSDFSWQLAAIYQHEFGVRNGVTWSGVLGYRAISVDYSEGNFAYDINQHGPVIGLSAKW